VCGMREKRRRRVGIGGSGRGVPPEGRAPPDFLYLTGLHA